MAREDASWLDDAFADEAASPRGVAGAHARRAATPSKTSARMGAKGYDWIDDAFDDSKADPLASKGMTGASSLLVVLCAFAVLVLCAVVAFFVLGGISLASGNGSL